MNQFSDSTHKWHLLQYEEGLVAISTDTSELSGGVFNKNNKCKKFAKQHHNSNEK